MSGTNVPPCTLTATGFVAPALPAVLAGVQADWVAAYASQGVLGTGLKTWQGQVMSSEAAVIGDADSQFLALANGIDPATATGRTQDAIAAIYFLEREPATNTVVPVLCFGAVNTVIPAGGPLAVDNIGQQYNNSAAVTISASGSVSASFTNVLTGNHAAASNSLTISQTIPGWDSITNSTGIPGSAVETSQNFELRRQQTVEANSINTNSAVLGAILALPLGEVPTDAYVFDNKTSGTLVSGGITLSANALYVAAFGGDPASIAGAIFSKSPPGTPYQSGTETITVQDTNPFYEGNGPTYSVIYTVPSVVTVNAIINIPDTSGVPSNYQAAMQFAYELAFTGSFGTPSYSRIGKTVYAAPFYPAIQSLGSWALDILEFLVGTGTPSATFQAININQISSAGSVTVNLI